MNILIRLFRLSGCVLLVLLSLPDGSLRAARYSRVDDLLARMTLEERVGQLFVIDFWGIDANTSVMQLLTTIHPAGAVLIGQNLDTPQQITQMVNELQTAATQNGAGLPLLIMTDQEGGTVQRLQAGFTRLPNPLILGAITDRALLVDYGKMVGTELAAVGVNVDLAPVVDLATKPSNPVLEDRMISDDPKRVKAASEALIEGMAQANVIGVIKHFPGHGEVADTHVNGAQLTFNVARLKSMELVPFVDTTVPIIMLGHISAPALDPSGLPATLSGPMIDYLRGEGNYEGVLMTDAMDMGAIINNYTLAEASVMAVNAGIDVILLGAHTSNANQIMAYYAVLNAVKRGEISQNRLNSAVRRVLMLKDSYGVLDWSSLSVENSDQRILAAKGELTLTELYRGAVTVVKNDGNLLPISPDMRVGVIYPNGYADIGDFCGVNPNVELMPVNFSPVDYQFSQAAALAKRSDVTIVFTEDAINNPAQQTLLTVLPANKVIVVALKSPYDMRRLPDTAGYVLAFNPAKPAFRAVCAVLFGKQDSQGVVPVLIRGKYRAGWGIKLPNTSF
jgi:beta-N-acetylhexosaminidase